MTILGPVNLTNCDREPIHTPGAIQPHGALVVMRADTLSITHVSANVDAVLGTPASELLGGFVDALFLPDEVTRYRATLLHDAIDARPVYLFTLRVRTSAALFDAIAHRNGEAIFLEFEPARSNRELSAPELYRLVQASVAPISRSKSTSEICAICAKQVRRINGFDRVMVYRFDPEWNGQVIAEDKRADLEPFFGLHYPASDIPQQARQLYSKNWLRFIGDRDYVPSPVLRLADNAQPGIALPDGAGPESAMPLDMSFSVLRSVSPIHLEYLRNMGVGASMSISLMREDKLWGLIACHHYSPRFVPYDVRTACEMLGQMMSLNLRAVEEREAGDDRTSVDEVIGRMLETLDHAEDISKALIDSDANLLQLIRADGAATVIDGRVSRIGQTPGNDQIIRLSQWIGENAPEDIFVTDCLSKYYGTQLLSSIAAGVLAIAVTPSRSSQLIWFRAEQVRTVDWAGDPNKTLAKGDGVEARLSPRGSFALWKETVKGLSRPWSALDMEAARILHDGVLRKLVLRTERLVAAHTDLRLASEEREKALEVERGARAEAEELNRMKDEFVATLSHELRTPLTAILGWSQIISHLDELNPTVAEGLSVIERNARAQSQIIEDLLEISRAVSGKMRLDLRYTHLPTVVEAAIETTHLAAEAKSIRFEKMIDPLNDVEVIGDPGRLQQVVWNLLANAVKFTPPGGKVQIVLQRVDSHVELSVSDNGQGIRPDFLPHVFDRFRQADASTSRRHGGLGLGLSIVRNLVEMHGGVVRVDSAGEGQGARFTVSLPIRAVHGDAAEPKVHPRGASPAENVAGADLTGVRALVVDDEPDARRLISRMLRDSACEVATASGKEDAIRLLIDQEFDLIISDIGMPGADGYDFIRSWRTIEAGRAQGKIPAIALTAYARPDDRKQAILAGFQAHVSKPVNPGELLALAASLSGRIP